MMPASVTLSVTRVSSVKAAGQIDVLLGVMSRGDIGNIVQKSGRLCLSVCLSTLDCRRVVAASMLTDPSQHSKHQKERALCS